MLNWLISSQWFRDNATAVVRNEFSAHIQVFQNGVWDFSVFDVNWSQEDWDLCWEEFKAWDCVLWSVDVLESFTDHHAEDTFLEEG